MSALAAVARDDLVERRGNDGGVVTERGRLIERLAHRAAVRRGQWTRALSNWGADQVDLCVTAYISELTIRCA
jgi:hypothetical protein